LAVAKVAEPVPRFRPGHGRRSAWRGNFWGTRLTIRWCTRA